MPIDSASEVRTRTCSQKEQYIPLSSQLNSDASIDSQKFHVFMNSNGIYLPFLQHRTRTTWPLSDLLYQEGLTFRLSACTGLSFVFFVQNDRWLFIQGARHHGARVHINVIAKDYWTRTSSHMPRSTTREQRYFVYFGASYYIQPSVRNVVKKYI